MPTLMLFDTISKAAFFTLNLENIIENVSNDKLEFLQHQIQFYPYLFRGVQETAQQGLLSLDLVNVNANVKPIESGIKW